MNNYRIQFISDIHLEHHTPPYSLIIQPTAPDLAICGDIGNPYSYEYADFLNWCAHRWERVFIVAGNHEYFIKTPNPNKTMEKIDTHIEQLCAKISPNIYYMQKSVVLIEQYKIAIIGATLWTAPDIRHWDILSDGFLGDPGLRGEYKAVYKIDENTNKIRVIHPSDIINIHQDHKAFISRQLGPFNSDIPKGYRVIILSHHLPSFSLISDNYTNSPLISTYASNQDALMKEPVVAWICGHSHDPITIRYDTGTLVTLNPLGYKKQDKKYFSRTATVVVHKDNIATRID